MGCDFSHGGLSMSYGGFRTLREKLAGEAGVPLRGMAGYGGSRPWTEISDPLVPLLAAFDEYGGGEIAAEHCRDLHPRIRELASTWSDPKHKHHLWHAHALALAHAVAEAAFRNEKFYWF